MREKEKKTLSVSEIDVIIKKMKFSDGSHPLDKTVYDISSIQEKTYADDIDKVDMSIFFKSEGQRSNNKPVKFNTKVKLAFYSMFKKSWSKAVSEFDPMLFLEGSQSDNVDTIQDDNYECDLCKICMQRDCVC